MLLRSAVVALLLAGALAVKPLPSSRSSGANGKATDSEKWLLPKTVIPTAYDLQLTTNIDKFNDENAEFKFNGKVVITVTVNNDADATEIVLHKADMDILTATFEAVDDSAESGKFNFKKYESETNKLTLVPDPAKTFSKGKNYKITIEYTGNNRDDMHGFYRSSYVNADNKTRWLLTTQFESYDARRAFPCFDEPEYKATYTISVNIAKASQDDGYHVLSNMPIEKTDVTGDRAIFTFQKSALKISSYLVAFIISDFKKTDTAMFGGVKPFVTWAQNGPIGAGQGALSQEAGPAALDVLKDLTKVEFKYPKVDQVGIPDFNAGAMENWGLVTYRERLILYNEGIHPISQKQSVVTVTTHELAHQWFGDLVTLHWWSDIWLNEGFATFFEYHASSKIKVDKGLDTSSWKLVAQMVVDELQAGAFATDAQPNSRALTTEVYAPGQIDANFDNVAYSKGGSVIRMWMHTLGKENFYKSLSSYLNTCSEGVGTPAALLAEFDKNVPAELKDVLKPIDDFKLWLDQAGYPVLHVNRTGNQSTITQERYLVSGKVEGNPKWTVPITVTTSLFNDTAPLPQNVFKNTTDSITIDHEDAEWVIFNIQQTGFYRVNYDADGWQALTNALIKNFEAIDEINRAQIIDDAMWLARSTRNYTDYEIPLAMTKYLVNETELIPWKAALNAFNFLYEKLAANSKVEPKIKTLIVNRIQGIFKKLTLDVGTGDSHTTRLLRPQIASLACRLGLKECVDTAKTLFAAHLQKKDDNPVHADVKGTVVCTGLRESGDDKAWTTVWDQYKSATDNSEQTTYLAALGCSKNAAIIKEYLTKTLKPEENGIRRQDLPAVFSSVINGNPGNVAIALTFLNDNYEKIAETYEGMDPLGGLITSVANKLGTDEDVKKITELKDKIDKSTNPLVNSGATGAKNAVDIVTGNNAWLKQKQESINTWLNSDENDTKTGGAATTTIALLALLLPTLLTVKFIL